MSDTSPGHPHGPVRYEIRIQGHLDSRWEARFDGMTLTTRDDGTTRIEGEVADQAALHGLLGKLRDIGLPLLSVTHVVPSTPTEPAGPDQPGQRVQPAAQQSSPEKVHTPRRRK